MDYINREAAIDELMKYTWYDEEGCVLDDWEGKREVIEDMLADIPAADVREVVRGEWVTKERQEHYPSNKRYEADYCTNCGKRGSLEYDFCPSCGAMMGGK